MARLLGQARSCLARVTPGTVVRGPEGVFVGSGAVPGKLAVLFPGQGAQYPDMLLDLACHFPEAQGVLTEADRAFSGPSRLVDLLYPPAAFSDSERLAQVEALRATRVAQPALGAVCLGAWRVLESFGVRADAVIGHSYGELTALAAAGRLAEADFFNLSVLRGQLMAERPAGSDPGTMLAVLAPLDVITRTLADARLDLVLANRNATEQTVLSGPTSAIDKAEAVFAARQVRTRRLEVAAAFHSPLVADAARPLRAALESVPLRPGGLVLANTTAAPYPDAAATARDLLAEQLARPVEFVASVEALARDGVRAFLEVGPGGRLSALVEAILAGQGADVLALDATSGRRPGCFDLGCVLAWLAARGQEVRLDLWDDGFRAPEATSPGHIVQLVGANYVKPRPRRPAVERASPSAPAPSSSVVHGTPTVSNNGSHPEPERPAVASPPSAARLPFSAAPPAPASPRSAPAGLAEALQVTRDSLAALQRLQEQTAQLHRQFLDGQEAAQRTVQALVDQQQRLLQVGLSLAPAGSVAPPAAAVRFEAPAPPPIVVSAPVTPTVFIPAVETAVPAHVVSVAPPIVAPAPVERNLFHSPAPADNDRARTVLLEVVAEKTGYPAEMLDLDMALDSDLGIDSIKRVEILSALQERLPEAPPVKPEHLGTLQTLRHIAVFLANAPSTPSAPPIPAPAPSPPAPALVDGGRARTVLLEVVAEKTGYPAEMLELDMALDSDLGIDSIKRVEILSALQERLPEAPPVKPEHLGTLQTLRHIADFLANDAPSAPPQTAPAAPPVPTSASGSTGVSPVSDSHRRDACATSVPPVTSPVQEVSAAPLSAIERSVVQLRALDAGRPRATLRLPVGSEVWVTDDDAALAHHLGRRLSESGLEVRLLPCAALQSQSCPPVLGGLIILAPESGCTGDFLRDALLGVRQAAPGLRAAGRASGALLATVSRLDGAFGLQAIHPQRRPIDGGLAGLAKTAAQEWSEVRCKALDLAPHWPALGEACQALFTELCQVGRVEVGLAPTGSCTLERIERPLPASGSAPLQPGEVVVVSGGARGVTAAAAVALARSFRPTLILLGRTPLDVPEPPSLAGLTAEADLMRELNRLSGGLSPRQLAERTHDVLAQREVQDTLARIHEAGSRAVYCPVDIRDAAAVAALLADIRRDFGPVRGLVHGAGVLADARLEDKTADQFDRVYGTKVDGLHALLAGLSEADLRVVVLFSSTTARLGRTGQADYAMANEVLNKMAQQLTHRLPTCRVLSLNWGPWAGGMVTPALKKLFESEGIGLIPLDQGAEYLAQELAASDKAVEVVVLGTATPQASASKPLAANGMNSVPRSTPVPDRSLPTAFERVLDLAGHPILESHVLDGRPVLPLALTLEWLAHGASVQHPGWHFHGIDDLRVLHGVTLDGNNALTLTVCAGKAVKRDGLFVVPTELRGVRAVAAGRSATPASEGREVLFARADVLLTSELPSAPTAGSIPTWPAYHHSADTFYRDLLFHGPDLHGLDRVEGCGPDGIVAVARTAPTPSAWLVRPLRQRWLADPLVLDSAFQMLILWTQEQRRVPNLPSFVARYRQFVRSFPSDGVRLVARVTRQTDLQSVSNIDILDRTGRLLAQLEGLECTQDANLARAFRRNRLARTATL